MLQRILVPIDGSPLSERALSLTETFARAHDAEVMLARVVEPTIGFGFEPGPITTADVYQEIEDAVDHSAEQHLETLVARLIAKSVRARGNLLRGNPGLMLLDCEQTMHADLVIIGTHGRSGLARLALGSVADQLMREGTAPVLLVRSQSPALGAADTALVPLDGSVIAEQALQLVKELAGQPLRCVHLLRVIENTDDQGGAIRYLEGVQQELVALGLEVHVSIQIDDPATAIAREAAHTHLVILCTHGRGGFARLRHGSVAVQVIHKCAIPTLVVRARTAAHQLIDSAGPVLSEVT